MIRRIRKAILAWLLAPLALFLCTLSACTSTPAPVPDAVKVMVPVPVACEIEQVPEGARPSREARPGMDIWSLTKIATAERRILMGETTRLRAANNNPCPGEPQ